MRTGWRLMVLPAGASWLSSWPTHSARRSVGPTVHGRPYKPGAHVYQSLMVPPATAPKPPQLGGYSFRSARPAEPSTGA